MISCLLNFKKTFLIIITRKFVKDWNWNHCHYNGSYLDDSSILKKVSKLLQYIKVSMLCCENISNQEQKLREKYFPCTERTIKWEFVEFDSIVMSSFSIFAIHAVFDY